MGKLFLVLTICYLLLITACNNKADKQQVETDSTLPVTVSEWIATLNDSTGRLEMKKDETAGPDSLTPSSVTKFLNTQNSNVKLVVDRQSNDTLFIRIPEAMYLTQQMGSTGPTLYFAQVVYNLTDIPGIKYVNFDFDEGDHASPGTYSRESFKDE